MFHEGQQIGLYTLIGKIGKGGFGEVWLAERKSKFVTTKVAVKLPLDEQVDPEAIRQEAALWEQASGHTNILPIIDADEYDGQVVIVSEYAPDGSLKELLRKNGGKLSVEQAVEMTIGILKGLEFLHSKTIIHRDLKPDNILLQGDTPRIADFGISRVIKTSLHATNATGTPYYMSPEAFKRQRTVQTDTWSVGVMLYEMLKGELPFLGNQIHEIFYAVTEEEPEPLPNYIPLVVRNIVIKSLAKEPTERYQTADEMRDELRNYLAIPEPAPIPILIPTPTPIPFVNPVPDDKPYIPPTKPYIPQPTLQPVNPDEFEIFPKTHPAPPQEESSIFKSLLKLNNEKMPKWIPILLWGIIGALFGAISFLSILLGDIGGKLGPGVVFGIAIFLFGEYSDSSLIAKRKRIYRFLIVIILSTIGWNLALNIGRGDYNFITFYFNDFLVAGIVGSLFIVTSELLCWNFKFQRWICAIYIVIIGGLTGFIIKILGGGLPLLFIIWQTFVLLAHTIAFGFGKRNKWLLSSTATLAIIAVIFFLAKSANSENENSISSNTNTNYNSYGNNTNYNYNSSTSNTNTTPLSVQYADAADKLYEEKKYSEAATNYKEAIRLDPKNDTYYNKLGNSLFGQEKYSEAETEFRLAVRLDPNEAVYQHNLGDALYNQKKYAEAVTFFNEAIKLNPNNDDYYNKLGNTLYGQENYSQALSQYKVAIRLSPTTAVYQYNLGKCFSKQKQYADAIVAYREAIGLNPNGDSDYYNDLGVNLYSLSKYSEAETAFKGAIKLKPKGAVLHNNLGDSLYKQSKYSDAIVSYKKALELDPNNEEYKTDLKNAETWSNLLGK